ncbi:hypothetical protein [Thermus phage TSP4]|nr:hypothetical protein [Thermus phage TSP4]
MGILNAPIPGMCSLTLGRRLPTGLRPGVFWRSLRRCFMHISAGNEEFFLAREGTEYLLINDEGEVVFRGTYQEVLYFLDKQADGAVSPVSGKEIE